MDATLVVLRAVEMIVGVSILPGEIAVTMVALGTVMGATVDVDGMVIVVCWAHLHIVWPLLIVLRRRS